MLNRSISNFRKNVRRNTGLAITGAFALIIALTWNDAIKAIVEDLLSYLDVTGTTYYYPLIAALITTIICVTGIMYFSKWSEDKK